MKRKSHYATLEKSDRLKALYSVLLRGGIFSTARLQRETGSVAIHSDIHELRQNGVPVSKGIYLGKSDGRKVYGYKLQG